MSSQNESDEMISHNESERPAIFLNSQLQDNGREVEEDQIVARHSCRVIKVTLCILMVIFFIILIIVDPFGIRRSSSGSHCTTNDAEHGTSNQTPERLHDDKPHNPCTGKVGEELTNCEEKKLYKNHCKPYLRRIELKNLFSDMNTSPSYVFLDRCDSACTWCGWGNQTCAPVNWDGRFAVRDFTIVGEPHSPGATIRIPVHSHCDCQYRHNIVAESITLSMGNRFNWTISSLNEKFNISKQWMDKFSKLWYEHNLNQLCFTCWCLFYNIVYVYSFILRIHTDINSITFLFFIQYLPMSFILIINIFITFFFIVIRLKHYVLRPAMSNYLSKGKLNCLNTGGVSRVTVGDMFIVCINYKLIFMFHFQNEAETWKYPKLHLLEGNLNFGSNPPPPKMAPPN